MSSLTEKGTREAGRGEGERKGGGEKGGEKEIEKCLTYFKQKKLEGKRRGRGGLYATKPRGPRPLKESPGKVLVKALMPDRPGLES